MKVTITAILAVLWAVLMASLVNSIADAVAFVGGLITIGLSAQLYYHEKVQAAHFLEEAAALEQLLSSAQADEEAALSESAKLKKELEATALAVAQLGSLESALRKVAQDKLASLSAVLTVEEAERRGLPTEEDIRFLSVKALLPALDELEVHAQAVERWLRRAVDSSGQKLRLKDGELGLEQEVNERRRLELESVMCHLLEWATKAHSTARLPPQRVAAHLVEHRFELVREVLHLFRVENISPEKANALLNTNSTRKVFEDVVEQDGYEYAESGAKAALAVILFARCNKPGEKSALTYLPDWENPIEQT